MIAMAAVPEGEEPLDPTDAPGSVCPRHPSERTGGGDVQDRGVNPGSQANRQWGRRALEILMFLTVDCGVDQKLILKSNQECFFPRKSKDS